MKHTQSWGYINRFIPATFWAYPKPGPGLPTYYVCRGFFCLHWFNLRVGYLFCWSRCCFTITIETLLPHNNMVYIRRRILVFVFYVVFQITEKLIKRSSSQEFTLAVFNLHPRSKGTIRLNSKDPFDSPRIDPRYLQDLYDVKVLISGKNLFSFMTYHRVCK